MATDRVAHVVWHGSLTEGSGTIEDVGSRAFGPLDVTWASRAEDAAGRTSPEELIAAAWASCFSMALSHALTQSGTPPEELRTTVTVTFQPGTGITKGALSVRARVPGCDEATFRSTAESAKTGCPVSGALTGIPEVTLDAALET